MAKQAKRIFDIDPWRIVETRFDLENAQMAESVFSLGNEYMGVRGFFEEGYSGKSLVGSYFNGIYATERTGSSGYKGIATVQDFMVNSVNWLSVRLSIDDESLDLASCSIRDYSRVLDMRNGLLTRSFVWLGRNGRETRVVFERFLSMAQTKYGAQRITITPLNFNGTAKLTVEADFGEKHRAWNKNYWTITEREHLPGWFQIGAVVESSGQAIYSASAIHISGNHKEEDLSSDKKLGKHYDIELTCGKSVTMTRIARNAGKMSGKAEREQAQRLTFNTLLRETEGWWDKVWEHSDIVIDGDEENQQGIRYCIFQMMQTYHGANPGNNIGAKGLTGETYSGNAFWDTETYCLPFFAFNNITAARNLLMFRYKTLEQAKRRAAELDCDGAFYPISTLTGRECCNLWQHASLQLQASTAVAYGIWFYEKLSGDIEFLRDYGAEMLVEISRMLVTRGDWTPDGTHYGYFCVMGPDEFQMMVNHNCYTNLMGKFTLTYTHDVLKRLKDTFPAGFCKLMDKLNVTGEELEDWSCKAEHMLILQNEEMGLFEQHDGYFKLPHVEVDKIPVEDFPLYHHWTYDRIYRNDMIKQPDVLMFMLMFNRSFPEEVLRTNYTFYEPRCIHESSLSPSVHSILASQLKLRKDAFRFFQFATRMDLDNYNRNTDEGLHTTSIAAAWMNIVYGFGGMRSDGELLEFTPTIPDCWTSYAFHVTYKGQVIRVQVDKNHVYMKLSSGKSVSVMVYGNRHELTSDLITIAIPQEWK